MNDLDDICGRGDPSSMTLGQLRANCQDFGQAFGLSTAEIVLLHANGIGLFAGGFTVGCILANYKMTGNFWGDI